MVEKHNEQDEEIVVEEGGEAPDLDIEDEETLSAESMKKLREKLRACEKEKQEHLDGWQRSRADFLNYKRRTEEETKRAAEIASARFVETLLPLLDSFALATQGTAWNDADPKFKSGFEMIQNQFTSILKDLKVERFEPTGEAFDPRYHEAISERADEGKSGMVVETIQPGYKIGDTILRAARVIVGT
jgi:molecular chaperone GrpE